MTNFIHLFIHFNIYTTEILHVKVALTHFEYM